VNVYKEVSHRKILIGKNTTHDTEQHLLKDSIF